MATRNGKPTFTGNRTGIAADPERASEMVAATREFRPSSEGDAQAIAGERVDQASRTEEAAREGSPVDVPLFMDKLGERLAFERAGTRLYEALLSKFDAHGSFEGGPTRDDIAHVMGEELEHFHLLRESIEQLGGDPTQLTPSANLQLTASQGVGHVLVDPRTTLLQSLEAIVMAELADNECWESLAELARLAGQEDLADRFEAALATEAEHLEKVRAWLAAGHGSVQIEGEGTLEETTERPTRRNNPKRKASARKRKR
jgi:rubrerythrin